MAKEVGYFKVLQETHQVKIQQSEKFQTTMWHEKQEKCWFKLWLRQKKCDKMVKTKAKSVITLQKVGEKEW